MKESEKELSLWLRTVSGEETAFRELFDAYFIPLCYFSSLITDDYDESEQLVIDLFARLWLQREKIHIRTSFRAYVYLAAKHRSLNYLKSRKKLADLGNADNILLDPDLSALHIEDISRVVESALETVSQKDKKVFQLSREEGASDKEIAETLGLSVKTVEGHKTRTLRAIRLLMKKTGIMIF